MAKAATAYTTDVSSFCGCELRLEQDSTYVETIENPATVIPTTLVAPQYNYSKPTVSTLHTYLPRG